MGCDSSSPSASSAASATRDKGEGNSGGIGEDIVAVNGKDGVVIGGVIGGVSVPIGSLIDVV